MTFAKWRWKLDSLRPGSREIERGRWEGQNFQLGNSALGRRRIYLEPQISLNILLFYSYEQSEEHVCNPQICYTNQYYAHSLYCRTVHVATLVIQSNSCTIHTLKHNNFNI